MGLSKRKQESQTNAIIHNQTSYTKTSKKTKLDLDNDQLSSLSDSNHSIKVAFFNLEHSWTS